MTNTETLVLAALGAAAAYWIVKRGATGEAEITTRPWPGYEPLDPLTGLPYVTPVGGACPLGYDYVPALGLIAEKCVPAYLDTYGVYGITY